MDEAGKLIPGIRTKGRKLLSILICMAMSAMLLAGCTSGSSSSADSASGGTASDISSSGGSGTAGDAGNQDGAKNDMETIYEYESYELGVRRGDHDIYGEIYVPQDAGEKMPAVIISHGFGGSHRVGVPYAEELARRGYVAYCFDFCGGSPGSRSDGSPLEMSVFTEQSDLEAVMEMIRGLDFVDEENLFLMGTSQGGAVSAITGAVHQDEVRGMILLYPAFILAEQANELFPSAADIPDTYYHMWMEVGRAYFEPLIGYDIYADAAGYEKDVLILHGDADDIVPLAGSERAVEEYESAELKVIPGAGHGFYGADQEQAVEYIMEYLDAHRSEADTAADTAAGRQIRMTAGDVEVYITLNDSQAAADLYRKLPLEMELIERNGFAKGMTLPEPLDTQEETTREYEIGDFGYWAAGPDLAIFYDDIYDQTVVPVIPLGKAQEGVEDMRDTSGTVRIEAANGQQ